MTEGTARVTVIDEEREKDNVSVCSCVSCVYRVLDRRPLSLTYSDKVSVRVDSERDTSVPLVDKGCVAVPDDDRLQLVDVDTLAHGLNDNELLTAAESDEDSDTIPVSVSEADAFALDRLAVCVCVADTAIVTETRLTDDVTLPDAADDGLEE